MLIKCSSVCFFHRMCLIAMCFGVPSSWFTLIQVYYICLMPPKENLKGQSRDQRSKDQRIRNCCSGRRSFLILDKFTMNSLRLNRDNRKLGVKRGSYLVYFSCGHLAIYKQQRQSLTSLWSGSSRMQARFCLLLSSVGLH